MTKKKLVLTPDVTKLVTYYLAQSDLSFSELTNKALKDYLVNALNSKQVCQALKAKNETPYPTQEVLNGLVPLTHWDEA